MLSAEQATVPEGEEEDISMLSDKLAAVIQEAVKVRPWWEIGSCPLETSCWQLLRSLAQLPQQPHQPCTLLLLENLVLRNLLSSSDKLLDLLSNCFQSCKGLLVTVSGQFWVNSNEVEPRRRLGKIL